MYRYEISPITGQLKKKEIYTFSFSSTLSKPTTSSNNYWGVDRHIFPIKCDHCLQKITDSPLKGPGKTKLCTFCGYTYLNNLNKDRFKYSKINNIIS